MATSPNFSWPEPDNTDLVKNGALAIRTAINAIDTSMVDLKGGTTGQVLSKASATDMDFSWVTDATGIPATIFDAKGDIIAATAADTASRLAVGANNTVLTADSSTATGLKWATAASGGGMTLISTTTLTGSGITLSSIPSTYNNLYLIIRGYRPATSGGLQMRFNADGNTRYYSSVSNDLYSSSTSYNASTLSLANSQNSGADNALMAVTIFDYTNTTTWKFINSSALTNNNTTSTDLNYRFGFAAWNQTGAISELNFYPASGNFTSGSILLYGVK